MCWTCAIVKLENPQKEFRTQFESQAAVLGTGNRSEKSILRNVEKGQLIFQCYH